MLRGGDGALWLGLNRDGIRRLERGYGLPFGTEQGVPEDGIGALARGPFRCSVGSRRRTRALALRTRNGPLGGCSLATGRMSRCTGSRNCLDGSLWASGNDSIVGQQGRRPAMGSGCNV